MSQLFAAFTHFLAAFKSPILPTLPIFSHPKQRAGLYFFGYFGIEAEDYYCGGTGSVCFYVRKGVL
jgi:hypothetical protein